MIIIFKTKTPFTFSLEDGKKNITDFLYYGIEGVSLDNGGVRPTKAYYYHVDEFDNIFRVYTTKTTVMPLVMLKQLEDTVLPVFNSDKYFFDVAKQRAIELFFMQVSIDADNDESFGTTANDWEVYEQI